MTDPKKPVEKTYNEKYGLDMSFDDALRRFTAVQKEELQEAGQDGEVGLLAEGHTELVPYQGVPVRRVFHEGEWQFSIVDVCAALTGTATPRRYWSDLKRQLVEKEGFSELYEEIVQLKMESTDGKLRETDTASPEVLFRIIQSIPSPKAERFKRWFAKVAYERIKEIQDPEIAIKRAMMEYELQGYPHEWIEQRIRSIVVRTELTAEWKRRGVEGSDEYAILSNVLSTRTFGIGPADHRKVKSLRRSDNLRDHMTDLELILTMLGEKSTKEIAQSIDAQGFEQNKTAARAGGDVAGNARRSIERETKKPVVSTRNFIKTTPKKQIP